MSDSDDYFQDEIDSAILAQVDAIEAAYTKTAAAPPATAPSRPPQNALPPPQREVIEIDDSYDYGSFDLNEKDLEIIDRICEEANKKRPAAPAAPVAGPSRPAGGLQRTSSATVQTTLFGGVVQEKPPSSSRQTVSRTNSNNTNNLFTGDPKKVKKWDHTAFAKTGWKKPKTTKGKEKASSFDDGEEPEEDGWEEEEVEFEQFPAPFISLGPPPPMKLKPDLLAARHWLYPLNQPRRDYQFNIVKRCLFENTLVALPTGLGKTFIAGVVMLNFYTWFPEGKVVFVAPTKPLVAQQVEACHKTCGIPGSHAVELTGQNTRANRAKAWEEKRVFYMTPQTLMNDLKTENCDPRDIVLLVIDEAHKGTGDYAYAQVIRYMMAKNPHFRVLALTATPGSRPEAVQAIVDSLHISHIEIRDEQSLDLAPYLHKKHIRQHVIHMSDDVAKIRDMLGEVMEPMITRLFNARLLHHKPTPVCLHPYSCSKALSSLHGRRDDCKWAYGPLSKLGGLARAMGYLVEGSLEQCYDYLKALLSGENESTGKQTSTKAKTDRYAKDEKLQRVLAELERMRARPGGFGIHPKMEKLKTLLVEHFAQKGLDAAEQRDGAGDLDSDSRVMVFTSFRQSVEIITAALNQEHPLIRAVPFIGQGVDKNGRKGYAQREQLEIIKRFKAGEFNVLVSTSIGEEGLDIGEIDMIACYDAQKTPIRMLQRIGRTGRKRDGYVHVLLSEEREERNWEKADDNYKDVQRFILRTEALELYGDVERLIPEHIKPECIEMVMDIEEYVREDSSKRAEAPPKGKKRVRNDDAMRNVPEGASTGFVSVKDLLQKGRKRKKGPERVGPVDFDHADESDEEDREIEAGILGPRRTVSMPAEKSKAKRVKRSATVATGEAGTAKKRKGKGKGKEKAEEPRDLDGLSASQVARLGQDDSEDEAIALGVSKAKPASKTKKTAKGSNVVTSSRKRKSPPTPPPRPRTPTPPLQKGDDSHSTSILEPTTPPQWSSSPARPLAHGSILDLASPRRPPAARTPSPQFDLPRWSSPDVAISSARKVAESTDVFATPQSSPVPIPGQSASISSVSVSGDADGLDEEGNTSMAWLLADDSEPDIEVIGSSPPAARISRDLPHIVDDSSEVEVIPSSPPLVKPKSPPEERSQSMGKASEHTSNSTTDASKPASKFRPAAKVLTVEAHMPPPALPVRLSATSRSPEPENELDQDSHQLPSSDGPPPATFAVRGPARSKKRMRVDSSPLATPSVSGPRRLHRGSPPPRPRSPSDDEDASASQPQADADDPEPARPPKRKKRKYKDTRALARANPWLDIEAAHSGSDASDGVPEDADAYSDVASSDAGFAGDFSATQAPAGYDQAAVYRRSLMTQAAPTASVPAFARGPVRRGGFRAGPVRGVGRARLPSSSPPREPTSEDEYELGTFVVDDDEEISYAQSSSILSQ